MTKLLRDQVKEELKRNDELAKDKWAAWKSELDKVTGEGKNLAAPEHKDEFERLNALKREHSEVAERVLDLRAQAQDVKEWETGTRPDSYSAMDENHGAEAWATGLKDTAKRVDAASRILTGQSYKDLLDSRVLESKSARVGSQTLGTALSAQEFKAAVLRIATTSSAGAFSVGEQTGIVVDLPQRQTRLLDLLTVGETDEASVEFVRELTTPGNAAFVAEADSSDPTDLTGLKPETSATYERVVEPTKIVAHWIPMTKKALRNQSLLRTFIESRLMNGVLRAAESSALGGAGGDAFTGIQNTVGTSNYTKGAGETIADAVHKQMTLVEIAMEDDALSLATVLHPTDWQTYALSKNANGDYINGKPSDMTSKQMWGRPVVTTTVIAQGIDLVGDFSTAMLLIASGVEVLASDGVENFFLKNMVALLAEMEAAFIVPQPKAFCEGIL